MVGILIVTIIVPPDGRALVATQYRGETPFIKMECRCLVPLMIRRIGCNVSIVEQQQAAAQSDRANHRMGVLEQVQRSLIYEAIPCQKHQALSNSQSGPRMSDSTKVSGGCRPKLAPDRRDALSERGNRAPGL